MKLIQKEFLERLKLLKQKQIKEGNMDQYKKVIELLRSKEFDKARNSQTIQDRKYHLSAANAYSTCLEVLRGAVTEESVKNSKY